MSVLASLWLPVLAAALAVFLASSLVHMVLRWHQSDFSRLPNEDAVRAALREAGASAGQYITPWCEGMKQMQEPDMQRKYAEGPIAIITTLAPGMPKMGPMLSRWFLLNLVLAAAVAAIAAQIYGTAGHSPAVGHLAGLVTFLAYATGSVSNSIWMGRRWSSTAKDVADALIYGVVTALAFWWLWPAAVPPAA